jgi:arabinofuranan 3-O-arabinosyltransferase
MMSLSLQRHPLLIALIIALCVLLTHWMLPGVGAVAFVEAFFQPTISPVLAEKDFGNYWIAAVQTVSGQASLLFQPDAYQALLKASFPDVETARSWSYSPHYLLLIWPFGFFDYNQAFAVFQLATFLLFAGAVWLAAHDGRHVMIVLAVSSAWAILNIWAGQNGFLTAAFFIAGFALLDRRPLIAGLCFAVLTIKPQLGLLIPLILVLERRWTVLLAATAGTVALVVVSALLFGFESWIGYLGPTAKAQSAVMTDWVGFFLFMMPGLFGTFRSLNFDPMASLMLQLPISIVALAITVMLARKNHVSTRFKAPCYGLLIFLFTPYAFNYDFGFVIALAALALLHPSESVVEAAPAWVTIVVLTLLAAVPVAGMYVALKGVPLASLALLVALLLLLRPSSTSVRTSFA